MHGFEQSYNSCITASVKPRTSTLNPNALLKTLHLSAASHALAVRQTAHSSHACAAKLSLLHLAMLHVVASSTASLYRLLITFTTTVTCSPCPEYGMACQGAPWQISLHIMLANVPVQESGQDIVCDEPSQRQAWTEVAAHVPWRS